jgi:hypothetical protein
VGGTGLAFEGAIHVATREVEQGDVFVRVQTVVAGSAERDEVFVSGWASIREHQDMMQCEVGTVGLTSTADLAAVFVALEDTSPLRRSRAPSLHSSFVRIESFESKGSAPNDRMRRYQVAKESRCKSLFDEGVAAREEVHVHVLRGGHDDPRLT